MTARETLPGCLVDELNDEQADAVIRQSWPRHVWPACCGDCNEGKRPCVTPAACQMAVDDDHLRSVEAMGWLLLYSVAVVIAIALLVVVSK